MQMMNDEERGTNPLTLKPPHLPLSGQKKLLYSFVAKPFD